jgi:diguanylate cyclase (GGDEF)-like protein/PAS domain S-box-containing protein
MITSGFTFVSDVGVASVGKNSASSLSLLLAGLAIFIFALCLVAILSDNNTRERLRRQKALTESAFQNISQGVCMYDANGLILMFNERYTKMTGMSPASLAGRSLLDVLKDRKKAGDFHEDPEAYLSQLVENIRQGKHSSKIMDISGGRVMRVIDHPMDGGGWVATLEDITDWKEAQAKISHMAHHDALTDLPNRRLFRDQLEQALLRTKGKEQVAVFCLDLDHFKEVNDSLGHPIGDDLLKEVAQRLLSSVRADDTVARLGGDEFAIVQVGSNLYTDVASSLATRVTKALSAPYNIHGHEIIIGVSVGITMAPHDGTHPDQLLKNADIALYRAKADGRGIYRFFEVGMDAQSQARRVLLIDLHAALLQGEFEVYYQPIHELKSNRIVCFEALVRWNHPRRGLISPADFIPLAEESGLIVAIGDWVLRRACNDAARWSQDVSVAVNLSPLQFKNRNLVSSVKAALAESGLAAVRLELEITEMVLLQETELTLTALHQLRSMGVKIAMDDFGTGYSSLSYLQSFPFDKIKIDQSFVRRLGLHEDALSIVRAVAGLGKSLGIRITAEGVETREQLSLLRAEGCLEVQGYLFDRPRPVAEVEMMLNQQLRVVS